MEAHTDIAIGNGIGSNIFNLLLVSGIFSTITKIEVPMPEGDTDLFMMVFLSTLLLPLSLSLRSRLGRGEALFAMYFAFMGWRVMWVV
jgi:cation:H+ antiporter|tara:strand:+ start:257 stop:520 length:264 start_codon:yes stop_codon:yes gene_type:complete